MGFYDAIRIGASGAAAGAGYTVDRSLRFHSSDTAYLSRTPSSTGNQKVWTWSAWVKRTKLGGSTQYLFVSNEYNSSGDGIAGLYFQADQIYTYYDTSGSNTYGAVNSRKYRDIAAWYHIVWQVDAANSAHKIWVNGVEETGLSHHPINFNYTMNQAGHANVMGTSPWNTSSAPANMYLAEVHFSDGYKYAASDFGETDATTGQWVPKASPAITYGTNGFYLNFSDNSGTTATTLGKDSSGNGNNFTPYNFSVSAGAGNDSVEDTPTNNWCTLNPLVPNSNVTFSEGNLKVVKSSAGFIASSNFVVTSGKWYMEVKYVSGTSNHQMSVGFGNPDRSYQRLVRGGDGELTPNTGTVAVTFADPDIIMLALDIDNGKWYIGKNGSYMLSGDPVNGTGFVHSGLSSSEGFMFIAINATSSGGQTIAANFGQQGFTYTPPTDFKALNSANLPDPTILLPNEHFNTILYSGTGNTTQNITGVGFAPDWVWIKNRSLSSSHYIVDAVRGLKDLHSDSSDTEGNSTGRFNSFDSDGFQVQHSGGGGGFTNGSGQNYAAWNWNAGATDGKTYTVKVVSDGGNKYRFDDFGTSAVTLDLAEGGTYIFDGADSSMASHPIKLSETSNGTHGGGSSYNTGVTYLLDGASVTESAYVSGYASATTRQLKIVVAASAPQLFYFCHYHSGMGGAINTNSTLGSSNFDGSIQSTAKVNASAGFSIVTYTGTGSNATVGHGLGVAPAVLIVKSRSYSDHWAVYHRDVGNTKIVYLNLTNTPATSSNYWNNTTPTSSVFSIGSDNKTGRNGTTYIAYCFSEVAGYSKFGKYVGSGSTDGTFVFTGFRPALVIGKSTYNSENWIIYDNKREGFNPTQKYLMANSSSSENAGSNNKIDFLSNGFKFRSTGAPHFGTNSAGNIYLAFAESPFKNARAR